MDIEFNSVEELYNRLKPALRTKEKELIREGYEYITLNDIWNFLKETKWLRDSDLALFEMTNDILKANNKDLNDYVKNKKMSNVTTKAIFNDKGE